MEQKKLIHDKKWDILIVMDALNYDIFKEIYAPIFKDAKTKLLKVEASALWTLGWFIETFHEKNNFKDTIIISSSTVRKTKDTKIYDITKRFKYRNVVFEPKDYFKRVIDVYKTGFDKSLGIVLPETITKETIKAMKKYPESRIICKYYQVHDPYLYYIQQGDIKNLNASSYENKDSKVHKGASAKKILKLFFSDETIWKVRCRIGKPPVTGIGRLWVTYGKDGIVQAYREDLKTVLKIINDEIVKISKDKVIVITTDHGENLGDRGMYGHSKKTKNTMEIPWLEVTS